MGGFGSGRPGYGYPKAEQMKRLDIAHLERRGYLRGGELKMWVGEVLGNLSRAARFCVSVPSVPWRPSLCPRRCGGRCPFHLLSRDRGHAYAGATHPRRRANL